MANDASTTGKARAVPKTQSQLGGFNDFTLISKFGYGYRNREDETVLPPGVLVAGSQNVLTNTFQRVGIRKGYTLDGEANTAIAPIGGQNGAMGVFDWTISGGEERNIRAGFLTDAGSDGKLQFRHIADDGSIEWLDIITGLTSIDFNFVSFYDEDTLQIQLLMVNGESNIRSWSGRTTTIQSASSGPTGIISEIEQPGEDSQVLVSGGVDYIVGDVLTISGGSGTATVQVDSISPGAIKTSSVDVGGSGWVPGDQFTIGGGLLTAFAIVTTAPAGVVTAFTIQGNGTGYSNATGVVCTRQSGAGIGLTVNITAIGNAAGDFVFLSDADHGSGYSAATTYNLTGGTGTNAHLRVSAVTSGTIVKEGTESWAEAGFPFGGGHGTESLLINNVTYTYLSDDFLGDTTTLYGISPDPSAIPVGSLVVDSVKTWSNSGGGDGIPDDFKNDLIGVLNARVFIGSHDSALVYLSDYASFKDWVLSSTFILTSPPTAFINQEDALYVSAGRDEWYKISFILNADLSGQVANIDRLNTTVQQASRSQSATTKIANSVAFLSFEPIIETFGPVQNIFLGPQMSDLSFPIVNDMNTYDFRNACTYYYRKFIYIAVPREGLVLMYNMSDVNNPYWEAPQILPINRFSVIDGELYGHSSQVSETYKLFTGYNDNSQPIAAGAVFSFNNYGTRSQSKGYDEFYVEGYISANTELTLGIQYDIDGCATITEFSIDGADRQIVCISSAQDNSLGKWSLGKQPIGSAIVTDSNVNTPKFRVIKTFPTRYFYEDQISFSSQEVDAQWEIIAFGPQLLSFTDLNNSISQ